MAKSGFLRFAGSSRPKMSKYPLNTPLFATALMLMMSSAFAGPVYQPSGANLTLGDVTHGQRVQSASTNPAAAAADLSRDSEARTRGLVFSTSAGLEYGNIQNLLDFYDGITKGYDPSDPGTGGGPGQDPDDKPDGGIDLGDILDRLDPDVQEAIRSIAAEVASQLAIGALIQAEGYGKAWIAVDVPIVAGTEYFGGAWTFGLNYSGSSKVFGLVDDIEFDADAARDAINDWLALLPGDRPTQLPVSNDVQLYYNPATNGFGLGIANDSSVIAKATRTTELNAGYSRLARSSESGNLFLGVRGRAYIKELTRVSVRFGDITNSEELFDAIRDGDFRSDTRFGLDAGALWVADRYQLGIQVTNINEPKFTFPGVDLDPYSTPDIIDFLEQDRVYIMDRQVKLEGSYFGKDRRWSAHIGVDADPATDPLGDEFQWLTLSSGFKFDSRWLQDLRLGYRENLTGSELSYVSAGLTAFRFLNLDLSSTLNTVRIDGDKLPRGLMLSLGFQITW